MNMEAWNVPETFDCRPDCLHAPHGRRARTWLRLPVNDSFKVSNRPIGVTEVPRHRRGSASAAGAWRRQLLVGAEAVDPGVDRLGGDDASGGNVGAGLSNPLCLPGEPLSPLLSSFLSRHGGVVIGHGVHGAHVVNVMPAATGCQPLSREAPPRCPEQPRKPGSRPGRAASTRPNRWLASRSADRAHGARRTRAGGP